MTKSDLDDVAIEPSEGAVLLKRALIGLFGGVTLILLAGVLAGYLSVVIKHAHLNLVGAVSLVLSIGLIGLVSYAMWRFWPRAEPQPLAPRIRSARNLVILMVALSVPLGILLGATGDGPGMLFSNGPISPAVAAVAIVTWTVIAPLITWLWWRKIDEHEADAYRDGALVAAHAYFFIQY